MTLLGGEQAHDRAGQHRLAGARLADDAERLAALEAEGDAVDGLDDARRRCRSACGSRRRRGAGPPAAAGAVRTRAGRCGGASAQSAASFTSKAARKRSPRKFTARTVRNMHEGGEQGGVGDARPAGAPRRPSLIIPPQLIVFGSVSPRKARLPSATMAMADHEQAEGEQRQDHVGQDLAHEDPPAARAGGLRGEHELALGEGERGGARDAGEGGDRHEARCRSRCSAGPSRGRPRWRSGGGAPGRPGRCRRPPSAAVSERPRMKPATRPIVPPITMPMREHAEGRRSATRGRPR